MDYFFTFAEIVGTVAFALSGALKAIQKNLDIFGVCVLAVFTALGGGVIRDLLLGLTPPRMFYSENYLLTSLGVALVTILVVRFYHKAANFGIWWDQVFNVCDALGLGSFAVIGTQAAMQAGFASKFFLCLSTGMITGVGGGALRDMMCVEIPSILRKHIYAVAALAGSLLYYILVFLDLPKTLSTFVAVAVTVTLRILARHYQWNLPKAMK